MALHLIDWRNEYRISAFYPQYLPAVEQAVKEQNLYRNNNTKTLLFFLDRNRAASIDVTCVLFYTYM